MKKSIFRKIKTTNSCWRWSIWSPILLNNNTISVKVLIASALCGELRQNIRLDLTRYAFIFELDTNGPWPVWMCGPSGYGEQLNDSYATKTLFLFYFTGEWNARSKLDNSLHFESRKKKTLIGIIIILNLSDRKEEEINTPTQWAW